MLGFFSADAGEVFIEVFDVAGRRIMHKRVAVGGRGFNTELLDTSNLGSGVYFVRVASQRGRATRKLTIVR